MEGEGGLDGRENILLHKQCLTEGNLEQTPFSHFCFLILTGCKKFGRQQNLQFRNIRVCCTKINRHIDRQTQAEKKLKPDCFGSDNVKHQYLA